MLVYIRNQLYVTSFQIEIDSAILCVETEMRSGNLHNSETIKIYIVFRDANFVFYMNLDQLIWIIIFAIRQINVTLTSSVVLFGLKYFLFVISKFFTSILANFKHHNLIQLILIKSLIYFHWSPIPPFFSSFLLKASPVR